jgi:beta-galactosidase
MAFRLMININLKSARRAPTRLAGWLSHFCTGLIQRGRQHGISGTAVSICSSFLLLLMESQFKSATGEVYVPPNNPRVVVDITNDWRFAFNPTGSPNASGLNDVSWELVDLPHTWNDINEENVDVGEKGVGWYRKTISAAEITAFAGKTIYLEFEGASIITDLYVDEIQIDFNPAVIEDSHVGGFATFRFDLTDALTQGQSHLLAVRTQNSKFKTITPPQAGDYTICGGLYRSVSLLGVNPAHIALQEVQTFAIDADGLASTPSVATKTPVATPGLYFTASNISESSASIQLQMKLDNKSTSARDVIVHSVLADDKGTVVAESETEVDLAPGVASTIVSQSSSVANPRLWNGRIDPFLYDLFIEVRDASDGKLIDLTHDRVGIRHFEVNVYDASDPLANGFKLNGQDYDLHGVNYHQDVADKGWAKTDAETLADLLLMVEMGVTVIRTSHYQHAQYFYDKADELGFVVYAESAINGTGGTIPTNEPNMTTFFHNSADQFTELIRQNYNHPSIMFWGIHNEVAPSSGIQRAVNDRFLTEMNSLCRSEDPSRMTTAATVTSQVIDYDRIMDSVTFNRYPGWYSGTASDFMNWADQSTVRDAGLPVGVGEYGAGANIHHHTVDVTDLMSNPNDQQWHPENYQASIHEQMWAAISDRPWMFCKTIWLMFDFGSYRRKEGAQPGINDKGIATLDRQTKDSFHFYQANWNDPKRDWNNEKVLYIADSRWTDRHLPEVTVKVYSNLGAPELKLNGTSLGTMDQLVTEGLLIPNTYSLEVTLQEGKNSITVARAFRQQTYKDSAKWTYHAPVLAGTPLARIDFTNSPENLENGYQADTGQPFGSQGKGTYGWLNSSSLAPASNGTGFLDGAGAEPFNELRYRSAMELPANRIWEYELPNRSYEVRIVSADAGFANMINNMSLEGFQLQDDDFVLNPNNPGISPSHDEFYARVQVADGRLTLSAASGAYNGRLAFIDINSVDQLALSGDCNDTITVHSAEPGDSRDGFGKSRVVPKRQRNKCLHTTCSSGGHVRFGRFNACR